MNNIIIVTHGSVSSALCKTCADFFGLSNLHSIEFTEEMSVESLSTQIKSKLENDKNNFVLTDIFAGTPFNAAVQIETDYDFKVVSGVNLAMVIAISTNSDQYINESKESIKELQC